MAGRVGYEYRYRFWMEADNDQIIPVYDKLGWLLRDEKFIFEIRSNFIITKRKRSTTSDLCGDDEDEEEIVDSERFGHAAKEDGREDQTMRFYTRPRLHQYWMTEDEIRRLSHDAADFARQTRANHPQSRIIPIVVGLDVCTVQQEGESVSSTEDRAIRAQNLVPLYLWPIYLPDRKPMTASLLNFLRDIPMIRVENNIDVVQVICPICSKNPSIGSHIAMLPCCRYAFHSHCIVRWLEDNNICPSCDSPVYDHRIALGPPFNHRIALGPPFNPTPRPAV